MTRRTRAPSETAERSSAARGPEAERRRGRRKQPGVVRPEGVADDAIRRIIRVPAEAAGTRLDVFVQSQLRNTSRTRARAIIENSAFSAEGRRLRASDRVRADDHVVLWRPAFEELDAERPMPVLFEDEHLLVIDKPPLVAVHPTARYHKTTVIKRLAVERPGAFLALVHRLDRETSGILLLAKTLQSERAFKRLLEDRSIGVANPASPRASSAEIEKVYLAITWGVPEPGLIDLPLELDPENSLRVKMRVATSGGLESKTEIELVETRGDYALVRCRLLTGRQHQIRIHLAARGTPVVGDKLYGPDERLLARAADGELDEADLEKLELPRHALHAHRMLLPHAMTGNRLELESPLPPDLVEFWQSRNA